ncbi:MAG: phospholipid-binding protein MlaC [Pseudomonadota bacterium]|jgi:phospholipid transport system substrate-binding protein
MITRIISTLVAVLIAASTALANTGSSPKAEMQKTIDDIIVIAGAHQGDGEKSVRRQKLRDLINPKFNFAEMSKRSLGAKWNELNPEQQSEFTTVFSELLARTYLSKIETVKPGMVKVESEQVEEPRAVVKTVVISQGDTFPIDYKLTHQNNTWQVYDVVIENIGLVANYRNEFSGIIRKDGFNGLMDKLRKKIA